MKEIWLIRHTTPKVDKGICYGQLDLDVTDSFDQELEDIRLRIDTSFQRVYSSPLMRCTKLANALFTNTTIETDKRLMELNFGEWEGREWNAIPIADLSNWGDNFVHQAPPKGESFDSLLQRVDSFMKEQTNSDNNHVAIVTHSGIIRAFLCKYLHIPAEKVFNLQLNYGAIVKITFHSETHQQVEFIKP
ncbi:alpha-ribazole phosphatase [Carboxylicivirga sp. M1479]|uniref:alpha-ribazole phosphatase n=1 Tax=Carboxylicivirga sp. M1479 TaxID=2594476 RepID=UPI0011780AB0|nr:alpha-ribazole phosphatase [Carboxylicivirga sp. M1479]TRX70993.1 alpha-ribazole phosphatase [Carboxylicivirga sp. M1479]